MSETLKGLLADLKSPDRETRESTEETLTAPLVTGEARERLQALREKWAQRPGEVTQHD